MSTVLHSKKSFGVVSPRSNNATLATIPLSSAPKRGIEKQESYELFLKMKDSMPRTSITPTAHGFCMLIKRSLIAKYGLFDEAFGKGYGEEVDFCQRIRQAGYYCLLANRAFVFHQEARSFSLEAKAKMLEVNNQIIWERYPNYRQEVRDYMQSALVKEKAIEHSVVKTSLTKRSRTAIKQRLRSNKVSGSIIKSIRSTLKRD